MDVAIIVPVFCTLFGVILVIFLRRYQNIERLNMIERGMNPSDLKSVWRKQDPYRHIRRACVAIGIGLGFIISTFVSINGLDERHGGQHEGLFLGFVCLFGGLGLLIGYIVQYLLHSKARKEGRNPYDDEI
jgi:hypothetical protein